MVNMPIATSQYWNIAYGMNLGEAAQDAEGMQTMRTIELFVSIIPSHRV